MTALLLALLFAAPERVVMVGKPAGPPGIFSRVRGSVRSAPRIRTPGASF